MRGRLHLAGVLPERCTVRQPLPLQEQRAAEAAERAAEDARELKEYRSQLTFKASQTLLQVKPELQAS